MNGLASLERAQNHGLAADGGGRHRGRGSDPGTRAALAGPFFHSTTDWSGVFIAALGAGNVIGSFRRLAKAPVHQAGRNRAVHAGLAMMVFAAAPSIWLSVAAAFGAGMACLLAGALPDRCSSSARV